MKKAFFKFLHFAIALPLMLVVWPIQWLYHFTGQKIYPGNNIPTKTAKRRGFPGYEAPPPPPPRAGKLKDNRLIRAYFIATSLTKDEDMRLKIFRIALDALRDEQDHKQVFKEWMAIVGRGRQ